MKRIGSSFVVGGSPPFYLNDERGRAEIDTTRGYSSRGVMRKIETTSAWWASGWAT